MNLPSIHDDISYLRKLAETGRKGPILGGIFLAGSGIVFGATALIQGAAELDGMPLQGWNLLYLWLAAFVVFALFWLFIVLRLRRRSAVTNNASTMMFSTIWSACGAGVTVAFLSTIVVATVTKTPVVLTAYVPVIFAFYGTAWFASAALALRAWMAAAGVASYLFAFALALLTLNPLQTIAMGGGLIVLLTLPGLKLVADEAAPKA